MGQEQLHGLEHDVEGWVHFVLGRSQQIGERPQVVQLLCEEVRPQPLEGLGALQLVEVHVLGVVGLQEAQEDPAGLDFVDAHETREGQDELRSGFAARQALFFAALDDVDALRLDFRPGRRAGRLVESFEQAESFEHLSPRIQDPLQDLRWAAGLQPGVHEVVIDPAGQIIHAESDRRGDRGVAWRLFGPTRTTNRSFKWRTRRERRPRDRRRDEDPTLVFITVPLRALRVCEGFASFAIVCRAAHAVWCRALGKAPSSKLNAENRNAQKPKCPKTEKPKNRNAEMPKCRNAEMRKLKMHKCLK
eukprot:scaffold825_cov249-Pinguiococcus_pyrenoidosus.AAC.53